MQVIKNLSKKLFLNLVSIFLISVLLFSTALATEQIFKIGNRYLQVNVFLENDHLTGESFQLANSDAKLKTDGNFELDVMWTRWHAPGKLNNAENPVTFSAKDFILKNAEDDGKNLVLYFAGINNRFELRLTYAIGEKNLYFRRQIALRDTVFGKHFLRSFISRNSAISGWSEPIKSGGFGQPVALRHGDFGSFWGIEYPAATNEISFGKNHQVTVRCFQEIGEKIGKDWLESDWVVTGISPDTAVKKWFMKYVDDIRVAKLRPYILYNSWYDLRAPEMVKDSLHIMNEENTMRIIELFQKNMVDKYNIHLDAFVLDDGWDIYKSDWVLRPNEFPRGLKPISERLKKMGTDLGIWFGPIGGYSHRDWRIGYMGKHGYELVGDELCLAGKNYRKLFKKRVVDFVVNDDMGYYKWDGIQFSCSEPDHGHPIGIYSRRAVMNAVVEMCDAVREKNPDIFLNITSGTWLSPWWVKYANTIWMQGGDFGYADVPSIDRRDASMTYRDFVLYEDFHKNNFWYPIANLMTHGIIKGTLRKLGGEAEPIEKFTDNALLYFARGVAMWELYISPDMLTDSEWKALGKSIAWARDRFEVLQNTEMVGGDPGERKPYGYVHFKKHRGIIAVRNPKIEADKITVKLSPDQGLCPHAASLVLERVYPTRWISPELYSSGGQVTIPLQGFETAVYEIYPLEEATEPLLAGVIFDSENEGENFKFTLRESGENVRLLNPEKVTDIQINGKVSSLSDFSGKISATDFQEPKHDFQVKNSHGKSRIRMNLSVPETFERATLALLLENQVKDKKSFFPEVKVQLNGKNVLPKIEQQKGRWAWFKVDVKSGDSKIDWRIQSENKKKVLNASASLWLVGFQKSSGKKLQIKMVEAPKQRPLPPMPWEKGLVKKIQKIGSFQMK